MEIDNLNGINPVNVSNVVDVDVSMVDSATGLHNNDGEGENLGKKRKGIRKRSKDWELEKIYTITVDSASANDGLVRVLKDAMNKWGTTIFGGKDIHMRCVAHIINLVVGEGTKEKEMNKSMTTIIVVVKYVRQSPMRLKRFKEACEWAEIQSKKLLCLDVQTRWNSLYLMLDTAEKFEEAFERLIIYLKNGNWMWIFMILLYKKFKAANGRRVEKIELEKYLEKDSKDEDEAIDVLQWWKMNEHRFPMLATMARDDLVVLISTVVSKLAFSSSGRVLDAFLSSLTPRMAQAPICAQDWLRDKADSISNMEEDLDKLDSLEKVNILQVFFWANRFLLDKLNFFWTVSKLVRDDNWT
ncbi:hypothetical protein SLEP1_g33941 [Rubroshorea leprosula]|uniref:HAT C-terminal dimerisation domain-containing protein n=1 Tax=Rubroshorea leprosula TaxID=152421 RepID=A0AAV5KIG5_9ROSI|nr:hypothetical protein SLEP1_g33941 [Rubroshorea leprosula]